ncbi:uncharacterized protein LOC110113346 [Dendrobium catenatum]|uniref:uncharacterized protein LOC110113346 n=1 Tax=Dendrobium catenatum TaxID=906689 RepID=UPI0009F367BB|nr:uncharacterized protein LOC110113346 [Dendrobium catenatum]
MKELSMTQYMSQIKALIDNIATSGDHIDVEDVILHTLNGLPSIYNLFKSAICTTQQTVSLDTLYSLLCSEEINLQNEQKDMLPLSDHTVLWTTRSNAARGRPGLPGHGRGAPFRTNTPRSNFNNRQFTLSSNVRTPTPSTVHLTCQICGKLGHIALNCWHRCNMQYAPTTSNSNPSAFLTNANSSVTSPITEWVLDSGASSHLTSDANQLQQRAPYVGTDPVSMASGGTLSIHQIGQGILPLPDPNRLPQQGSFGQ